MKHCKATDNYGHIDILILGSSTAAMPFRQGLNMLSKMAFRKVGSV